MTCMLSALLVPLVPAATAAEPSLETLAARVQVLEDRESIRKLILAYGTAHDNRDYRTFANLFAREGGVGEWHGFCKGARCHIQTHG